MEIPSKIKDFIAYILFWIAYFHLYILFRFIGHSEVSHPLGENIPFETGEALFYAFTAGIAVGILFGVSELIFDIKWFKKQSFGRLILLKAFFYLLIFSVVMAYISISNVIRYLGAFEFALWAERFFNVQILIIMSYYFIGVVLVSSVKQLSQMMGKGNLVRILLGKYHKPIEEERIFMFLDLKSSTTIAEELGHVRYSRLIQDCFDELSVVKKYKAEVYQYVGDEAVLSWKTKEGLQRANCLKAYFAFHQKLEKKSTKYIKKYGITPFFKAGVHIGRVTVAEVGSIKKEIAFHGDTLNTAARVQAHCNILEQKVLITDRLKSRLDGQNDFSMEHIGSVELRGKMKEVELYAVDSKGFNEA